jgi:hypothetical protein
MMTASPSGPFAAEGIQLPPVPGRTADSRRQLGAVRSRLTDSVPPPAEEPARCETALEGLTSVAEDVLQDMHAEGEEIPAPWDERWWGAAQGARS